MQLERLGKDGGGLRRILGFEAWALARWNLVTAYASFTVPALQLCFEKASVVTRSSVNVICTWRVYNRVKHLNRHCCGSLVPKRHGWSLSRAQEDHQGFTSGQCCTPQPATSRSM